jgi:hypothetical protein
MFAAKSIVYTASFTVPLFILGGNGSGVSGSAQLIEHFEQSLKPAAAAGLRLWQSCILPIPR